MSARTPIVSRSNAGAGLDRGRRRRLPIRPAFRATSLALVLGLGIGFAFFSGRSHAQGQGNAPGPRSGSARFVQDEILIQFHAGASEVDKADARGFVNAQRRKRIRVGASGELELATLPPGMPVDVAAGLLSRHPAVSFAEPNWIYTRQQESSALFYAWGLLWGLYGDTTTPSNQYGSQAGEAWAAGKVGSRSVVVAVIDQGIDPNHSELAPNMWVNPGEIPGNAVDDDGNGYVDDVHGWDFFNDDSSIYDGFDFDFHGTHVAGTIGASGAAGILVGVNWNVTLISAKFIGANEGTSADAVRALDYLVDLKNRHGLDLVATNNSYGGDGYSQSFHDAIIRAAKAGILFVAAAGNGNEAGVGQNNDATAHYPSNYSTLVGTSTESAAPYDSVIAVAAIDSSGGKASFSNYGATTVDLGAPGVAIYSSTPDGSFSGYSGTSMAAPHVTGAVALYASMNPEASADLIKAAILDSAVNTPTASLSSGTQVATQGRLNIGWFTPQSTDPPTAPSGLTATANSSSQITLQWADNSSNENAFQVERCEGTGCTAFVQIVQTAANAVSFSDTGLPASTRFEYRVRAVNANGGSDYSNTAGATTFSDTPPDFVVSALSGPATAAAGDTIVVTDTTTNQSPNPGPQSRTGFYLSVNSFLDGKAVLLDDRQVPELAASGSDTRSTSLVIPAGTTTGSYFLLAKADYDSAVGESQEGNNVRVFFIRIGPDLTVTSLAAPSSAAPGSSITVSDTTANSGAGQAEASTTRFYLSSNFLLDASDPPIGSRSVPSLGAGQTSSASTSLTLPASLAGGTYYVVAQADGGNAVTETMEANNTRFSTAVFIGPDLVVSSVSATIASSGETLDILNTTKNQGATAAGSSTTAFYLSTNFAWDASDVLLGSRSVTALAAGGTSTATTTVALPPEAATGTYYVLARADANGQVTESNESNNVSGTLINLGSDLAVSALSVPAAAGAGDTIAASDTTKNQGVGTSGASTTGFYLSTNVLFDAADVRIGGRPVPSLGSGQSSSATTNVQIPSGTATGTYFVLAVADANGQVPESLETNNSRPGVVYVGPDLTASNVKITGRTSPGATIAVTDKASNLGGGAAPASTTSYYLSSNVALDAGDVFLGGRAVPGLAPGGAHTGSADVTLPAGLAPGTYYLFAVADGPNAVPETKEYNNNGVRSMSIK